MAKQARDDYEMSAKLDTIIRLLEDLFILEASKANMRREELRRIARVDMNRVSRISKHLGKGEAAGLQSSL